MGEPIENEYFNWLCAKVLISARGNMYIDLLRIMYMTPFEWSIPGDKNRAEDGQELRLDFLRGNPSWALDPYWFDQHCSVLEMLIALSYRAAFQTDIPARNWFWQLITNLGLDECRYLSRSEEVFVKETIHRFNTRRYTDGGQGGIFPLRWPKHDQRRIEIWHQFCAYLDEHELA